MTTETTNPVNESSKQVNASDKVPHSEEQTTQLNTKDGTVAQETESRLDVVVGDEQNKTQKSDGGVCESTRSNMAVSAATIITCSSEIKSTSQKETPSNSSFDDMDKDNPSVNAVNLLHDLSVILAGKTTIISNDEKSSKCEGGIMTTETTNPVNESSKQVNASDKVPHSEEQTTQLNTKDVNVAQETESRLDVDVGDEQNKAQESDGGVSENTRSNIATIITCSSEIKSTSQKETPATNSSFNDMDKDNPSVNVVNLLHDQFVILAGKTTLSNHEKYPQCDGGIMTVESTHPVNEFSKQLNGSDKVPLLEEQTTHVNTKDVNDAQKNESRFDVNVPLITPRSLPPAMEFKKRNKRSAIMCNFFAKGHCHRGTSCWYCHINDTTNSLSKKIKFDTSIVFLDKLTDACVKDRDQRPPLPPANSSSRKRKKRSKDRKILVSDLGLSFGEGAYTDLSTTDGKSPQCDGGIITAETSNPVRESSKQVNASGKFPHSEEQTTQVNTKDVYSARQIESRWNADASLINRRRLLAAIKIKEGKKRSANTCRFFAEGWCNRGLFCKFRHIKGTTNVVNKQNETRRRGAGVRQGTRSNMAVIAASIAECFSEIKLTSPKETPASNSSFNDMDKDKSSVNAVNLMTDQSVILSRITTTISNDEKSSQCVGDKQNETKKGDEGVSEGTRSNMAVTAASIVTCFSEIKPTSQKETLATNSSFTDMDKDNPPVNAVNSLHDQSLILAGITTKISNDEKSFQCVGDKHSETQKSEEGVSERTGTNMAVSAATAITCSSDIKLTSQKETPTTNSSFTDMHKDNPPVEGVNLLHDQSLILAGKTTMISDDGKSPQCDGGIMTAETTNPVNESSKQVNASGKDLHSEEQTAQVFTQDVNEAQQTESRLDVDAPLIRPRRFSPAIKIKEGKKRPSHMCRFFAEGRCNRGRFCKFRHIEDTTNVVDKQNETRKSDEGAIERTGTNMAVSAATAITCSSEIVPRLQKKTPATDVSFNDMDEDNPPVDGVNLLHDQFVILAGKTTMIFNDEKSSQCIRDKQKETKKSDEGVSERTGTNMAVSAANAITCSSDIKPTSQKETPITNSSFTDIDKDNPPVDGVNLLQDQSLILAGNTTMLSNGKKSHDCDGGIITSETSNPVNESCKQVNASDTGLVCPDKLTDASVKYRDQQTPSPPAKSSSKKRKKRSEDRKLLVSDLGLLSADTDPSTTDEILNHAVAAGEIRSRMNVSERAGCSIVEAMSSVSQLIKCYDKKVETEKRLRERIKRYRVQMKEQAEENLKNAKRLKKLKSSRRSMSEKENEALRMMAEKEAEHKKEVYDLMVKLEKAYKENVQLQRQNVGMAKRLQRKNMKWVNETERKALEDEKSILVDERLLHESAVETICERQASEEDIGVRNRVCSNVTKQIRSEWFGQGAGVESVWFKY